MNYEQHYTRLIERAKSRPKITGYTEVHHIIPRCLGGDNSPDNLVRLTPEEHYVAHQLLVKLHPEHDGLVWAAIQMTRLSNGQRANNKIYGWIRKKLQLIAKQRIGNSNGSFGKPWYHDPVTNKAGKFVPGTQPQGWVLGRCKHTTTHCIVCGNDTQKMLAQWCDTCRPKKEQRVFKKPKTKNVYSNEEKIQAYINCNGNIRRALFSLGLNDSGSHYRVMKELCASIPLPCEGSER